MCSMGRLVQPGRQRRDNRADVGGQGGLLRRMAAAIRGTNEQRRWWLSWDNN